MHVLTHDIAEWVRWMKAANHTAATIKLRVYQVKRVLSDLGGDPWEISADQLIAWLAAGVDAGWKPNTLRSFRTSMRTFYSWGQGVGRRPDNPALLVPRVAMPRGLPRPTPEDVYRAAIAVADERVRLMIHLGAVCGLRRSEIARVRYEDVVQDGLLAAWRASTTCP